MPIDHRVMLGSDETLQSQTVRLLKGRDAVRMQGSRSITVRFVTIVDRRIVGRDEAHSDGVQLVPVCDRTDERHIERGNYAGVALVDGIIDSVTVIAHDSLLQGIFSSDARLVNLRVTDCTVDTDSVHKITLAGFQSGWISNNRDSKGNLSPVTLERLRLGGRPQDSKGRDGYEVFVIGFKDDKHAYRPLSEIIDPDDGFSHVVDNRTTVDKSKYAIYLDNFDLDAFLDSIRFVKGIRDVDRHCGVIQAIAVNYGDVVFKAARIKEVQVFKHDPKLGELSRHHESGNKPGAIGFDRTGGYSYGFYQLASKVGTMAKFLKWLSKRRLDLHHVLQQAGGDMAARAGKPKFQNAWKTLAATRNDWFQVQHYFIQATHYEPVVERLRAMGFEPDKRSAALRDVIWSTAVQHGAHTNVITRVLAKTGAQVDDKQLITAIYAERRTRFGSSTRKVRAAVMNRFDVEMPQALQMLARESRKKQPEQPVPPKKPAMVEHVIRPAVAASTPQSTGKAKPKFFTSSQMRNL